MISTSVRRLEDSVQNNTQNITQLTAQITRLQRELKASEDEKDLTLVAYRDEKEKRRHWYFSYKDKHRRIGELIREKFASQLLIRNYGQRLQQYRNNNRNLQQELDKCQDDLFLSDIQLDNKWGKWKRKEKNSRQIILNQNQNILNLQQQNLNI